MEPAILGTAAIVVFVGVVARLSFALQQRQKAKIKAKDKFVLTT